MAKQNSFYKLVMEISEDYFGPATPRFINRITTSHLSKPADRLTEKDLPELIAWVQLAANVMTDNTDAIEQYVGRLHDLLGSQTVETRQPAQTQVR